MNSAKIFLVFNAFESAALNFVTLHHLSSFQARAFKFKKFLDLKYIGQRFHQVWYQGIEKATVSGVIEDLTFKISEGMDQTEVVLRVPCWLAELIGQTQDNLTYLLDTLIPCSLTI